MDLELVSRTALWTAAGRAWESQRTDRLFDDRRHRCWQTRKTRRCWVQIPLKRMVIGPRWKPVFRSRWATGPETPPSPRPLALGIRRRTSRGPPRLSAIRGLFKRPSRNTRTAFGLASGFRKVASSDPHRRRDRHGVIYRFNYPTSSCYNIVE